MNNKKPKFQELKVEQNESGVITSMYMMNIPDISQSDKGKLKTLLEKIDDLEFQLRDYPLDDVELYPLEGAIYNDPYSKEFNELRNIIKELLGNIEKQQAEKK